jgi:hypothetical protein
MDEPAAPVLPWCALRALSSGEDVDELVCISTPCPCDIESGALALELEMERRAGYQLPASRRGKRRRW